MPDGLALGPFKQPTPPLLRAGPRQPQLVPRDRPGRSARMRTPTHNLRSLISSWSSCLGEASPHGSWRGEEMDTGATAIKPGHDRHRRASFGWESLTEVALSLACDPETAQCVSASSRPNRRWDPPHRFHLCRRRRRGAMANDSLRKVAPRPRDERTQRRATPVLVVIAGTSGGRLHGGAPDGASHSDDPRPGLLIPPAP
jgi:hypothetical protein